MATQPANTYTRNIFNPGVQKNVPLGFVDLVYDKKTNNIVGFVKNDRFYNLGDKVVEPKKKTTSVDVSRKIDIFQKKVDLLQLQVTSPGIKGEEKSRLVAEYNKTQDELNKAKRELDTKLLEEGKIDQKEAAEKASETLRFEIRALEQRESLMRDLGQNTTQVRGERRAKESQLQSLTSPQGPITQAAQPTTVMGERGPATEFLRERGAKLPGQAKVRDAEVVAEEGATGGARVGTGAGAVTTRTTEEKPEKKKSERERYEDAYALAQSKYNMPEIIFENVPSLGDILRQFVDGKITRNGFITRVQNDNWYRQNSETVRNRYLQMFNYDDLRSKGQAVGTSSFEISLRNIIEDVQDEALALTGSRITDDEAVEQIAKDLYIYGLETSKNEIRQRISKFIRPTISRIGDVATEDFGGEAGQNYNDLLATARANGFKLEQILPKDAEGKPLAVSEVLQRIATGKIDVNRIKDDIRKLAAVGQADFVKDQLAQGNDLDVIYSPYRQRMAQVLEIEDPLSIDLNDPSLRMGITKEGDMNIFDYEKALRKDSRWRFTESARDEAASVLDTILRDFGFRS